MNTRWLWGIAALSAALRIGSSEPPKVGDPAPDFTLTGSDGAVHKLSDHAGKRPVILAWFPKAFTGG